MNRHRFIGGAVLCAAAGLWIGGAFAAACARLTQQEILRSVNDRLEREFISHDGLLLDYVGEIPTAAEIADLKPNAMGWWSPIENGSMFTGEWLPALMAEGALRKALVEKCVRGLIKMSEISDVPGFIARGTGTDGKSHHPLGSNDQTDPWFFGLCEYCRWPHADPALKAKALERLVFVARALERNGWGVPCDGAFTGENRGNLNAKAMPFWGKSRLLYSLKSLHRLTGDAHWGTVYGSLKGEALNEIEVGGEIDKKAFSGCYGWGVWVYLSSVQALAQLIEMEENPQDRARMRKGLLLFAERVAPLMKERAKYANTTERPFKYANWRTGYAWRVQKTQKDAEAVAHSGKREILGTRKDYERSGMSIPLCAAAICALSGETKYRDEILATLRHYDYSTPNISEFFHAAVAAACVGSNVAITAFGARTDAAPANVPGVIVPPTPAGLALAPGFTIRMKVDCAGGVTNETLYTYGAMTLSLRLAGAEAALREYDVKQGNYVSFPLPDRREKCPVLEATICEKGGRVGIPLGFLREPLGVHDVLLNWTGAKFSIRVDGALDEEMPNPVKCPVVWPANPVERTLSPRVRDVSRVVPNLPRAIPALPDSRLIEKPIQYWTPQDHNASVGDVVVCNWDGRLHVFYLLDRRHHRSGLLAGRHFFAHFSSPDLVRWYEHPHATELTDWWQTNGTGTPFRYEGRYCLAYGLHTGRFHPLSKGFPRGGTYAISDDAIHFRPTGEFFTGEENPSVFNRADGVLCMGLRDGRILRSSTGKLADLRPDGPGAKCGGDCPCPFSWGDYDYMLQGFFWMSARRRGGAWEDWTASGDDIYDGTAVPMVAEWKSGRRIYAGWINGVYGWGGHFVIRELVQFADGKLGLKWLDEAPPPGDVREYEVTDLAHPFVLRFSGADDVEFRVDPAAGRAQFTFPQRGAVAPAAQTAREIVAARPEGERFSRRNQKGDFAWKMGPVAIERIRGLDRPFKVRFAMYFDPKFNTTIFDAEIAGTRCLLTRRMGPYVQEK